MNYVVEIERRAFYNIAIKVVHKLIRIDVGISLQALKLYKLNFYFSMILVYIYCHIKS